LNENAKIVVLTSKGFQNVIKNSTYF